MDFPWLKFKWDHNAGPVVVVSLKGKNMGLALICHRRDDRCFHFHGHKSLLCARCTGIVAGALFLLTLNSVGAFPPLWLRAAFVAPMLIDGFTQLLHLRTSNNLLRLATGLLFPLGLL